MKMCSTGCFAAEDPTRNGSQTSRILLPSKAGPIFLRSKICSMGSSWPINWDARIHSAWCLTPSNKLKCDHGHQYISHVYAMLIRDYAITPSMSRRGNGWDNAPMENFFGHLKEEALRHLPTPSFEQARQLIDEYIHFYNYERIQLKTRQTPYETRCLSA